MNARGRKELNVLLSDVVVKAGWLCVYAWSIVLVCTDELEMGGRWSE